MEQQYLDDAAIQAYLQLMALNMRSWKPDVAAWLHSDAGHVALGQLLVVVPCSPTVH
jgi:hypothetical protein